MTENYKCLECFIAQKRTEYTLDPNKVSQLQKQFVDYENVLQKSWKCVKTSAKNFGELVRDVKQAGYHPEDVFSGEKACDVFISLLSSGIRNPKHLSEILTAVYHCVRISRRYHYHFYNARGFWRKLFDNLLTLPDQQFFESVMVFFLVVGQVFTDQTFHLCCSSYKIIVDDFLYLTGSFFPWKMFPIFKKLHDLEEKNFSSKHTAFTIDYRELVSPLFAPAVAQKEWYSLKQNRPVDFMLLMVHLSLRRPVIIDLLFVTNPGVPVTMSILREASCKHMHPSLVFSIDAMLSMETTNESRFDLLYRLMHQLDYPLLLKVAINDDLPYLRALAQKVILHTLRFLDAARKSDVTFKNPHRVDLLNVGLPKLKDMISTGGIDDKIFAFTLVTEHVDNKHDQIIKDKFQDLAVSVLNSHEHNFPCFQKESRDQLVARALNLLVSIGPLDEKKYQYLMRHFTVKTLSKFFSLSDKDIKLLSRVCTVNICQTSFDRKLELFRIVPLKTLVDEIYEWYQGSKVCQIKHMTYTQLMPVTAKLIHYYLCIMYHMKMSGVLEKFNSERMRYLKMLQQPEKFGNMYAYINGENWTKMLNFVKEESLNKSSVFIEPSLGDKMGEVFSATVFDPNMPERYDTIAVACLAHLMHDDKLDVSKFITRKLIIEAFKMYSDPINTFYLSDGGDFKEALTKTKFSKFSINEKEEKGKTSLATANNRETEIKKKVVKVPKKCEQRSDKTGKKNVDDKAEKSVIDHIGALTIDQASLKVSEKPIKKQKTCTLPSCPRHKQPIENKEDFSDVKVQRMKKCARCRGVVYCGKDCQISHWSEHKKVCKKPS